MCPEVDLGFSFLGLSSLGLDFSLLGFERLDSSLHFLVSRGWIILCHFCRCGCGCGVRGDLEIRHRSVLVDLECSHDATHNFLWSHSRSTRARSSSSFVALVDFKLQPRHQDTMAEPSWGVRWVVFVFDLLLNFQFVFSHLVTFGRRLLDSVLLSDFVLDLFVHAFSGLSGGPPRTPSWTPPQKWPLSCWQPHTGRPLFGQIGPGPLFRSPAAIYCSQNVAVAAVSLESLSEFVCACGAVAFQLFIFS